MDIMKKIGLFSKVLLLVSSVFLEISTASSCGMGNEDMPESLKKLR